MRVVTVANLKGGVGKTTLAVHLAVRAGQSQPVVLIDLDPQGSTLEWIRQRGQELPTVVPMGVHQVENRLMQFRKARLPLVIIDTPAALVEVVETAIRVADLVLVPVRPTPTDLAALPRTLAMARAAGKPVALTLSQAITNSRLTHRAVETIDPAGPLLPAVIHHRTALASAMATGATAAETDPRGKAAAEVEELWQALVRRLAQLPADIPQPAAR
ncbi:MAG: AAA family ATPase [Alphaproteobacteria bacterium]|nr:AAA family ATPase [Alphaproteobacteria bacterium]